MVPGLDRFKSWFEGLQERHVIIGGTACTLYYERYGAPFVRSTKDIDLVVLAEGFDREYYHRFMDFVTAAGYQHRERDGRNELYRFWSPVDSSFPAQVELLSKRPDLFKDAESVLGRFRTVDASYSLSAILLDDDYYELLADGIEEIDGLPVLSLQVLPVLKMHAWMNLVRDRESGRAIHSDDINKHRSDVCKLCSLIVPQNRTLLPRAIREEVAALLERQPWDDNMLRMWRIPLDAKGMKAHIAALYLEGPAD